MVRFHRNKGVRSGRQRDGALWGELQTGDLGGRDV